MLISKKSQGVLLDIKIIKIRFTGYKEELAGRKMLDATLEELGTTYKSIDRIVSTGYVKKHDNADRAII
jgi:activator of 2-hydroxyglutaryl-CoA dehydratase